MQSRNSGEDEQGLVQGALFGAQSLAQAVGFGFRHSGSLLSASLISVSCFGVLWGLAVLGGLLAKIPSVGPLVVSLLWLFHWC